MACRVSTITATARLGARVGLEALFDAVPLPGAMGSHSVIHARYMDNHRGTNPSKRRSREQQKSGRRKFDNYVTLVLASCVNVKVFECGSVQMTGIKSIDAGSDIVDELAILVNRLACATGARRQEYRIQLINAYFSLPIKVHRARLHQALHAKYPQIKASFEPCLYPGVRVELTFAGPKTTVMVFHSGTVMIAGAKSMEAVQEAHAFVTTFVKANQAALSLGTD